LCEYTVNIACGVHRMSRLYKGPLVTTLLIFELIFISGKWPTWRTILFPYMFISILYMFRATSCTSSGELIVSIQRLQPKQLQFLPDLHTRRSPTQSDIYQTLYWYNWFSWWWAQVCSKHVENWNKHVRRKNCTSSWSFTRIIPRCTVSKNNSFYLCMNNEKYVDNSIIYVGATKIYISRHDNKLVIRVLNFEI
jgi:hypothetical protein